MLAAIVWFAAGCALGATLYELVNLCGLHPEEARNEKIHMLYVGQILARRAPALIGAASVVLATKH